MKIEESVSVTIILVKQHPENRLLAVANAKIDYGNSVINGNQVVMDALGQPYVKFAEKAAELDDADRELLRRSILESYQSEVTHNERF